MQGQEKIIDELLSSARSTAAAMVEEANAAKEATIAQLREELSLAEEQAAAQAKQKADAVYSGQVKLGELEANKVLLDARQKCVAAVYDGVRERILSAPDAQYLALMQKLIVEVCEDGDEVIAAKSDKRITAEWVKKVSTAAKKKLTLSATKGDFSGGVVLRNARYDRSLTVDDIVAELKERTVSDTVRKLGI